MRTNVAELVHAAHTCGHYPFLQPAMASDFRRICDNRVIADLAVVGDMTVIHQQHMVANARYHAAAGGAAMNRGELTDAVVIADFQPRSFTVIFQILGLSADRGKLEDPIAGTNCGLSINHRVGTNHRLRSDPHAGADDRAGTHPHAGVEFRAAVNYSGRMNFFHRPIFMRSARTRLLASAEAASASGMRRRSAVVALSCPFHINRSNWNGLTLFTLELWQLLLHFHRRQLSFGREFALDPRFSV